MTRVPAITKFAKIRSGNDFFFYFRRGANTTTTNIVDPSNVTTARPAPSPLPPLFRRRFPLPYITLRCFPLSRIAGRHTTTSSVGEGFFVQSVAQRGQFALRIGRVGVGRRWGYAFA
jgi:hypothetical protein